MKIFLIGSVGVGKEDPTFSTHSQILSESMSRLGKDLALANHDLLVCSPFPDSADVHAARGALEASGAADPLIAFHHPGDPGVVRELSALMESLPSNRYRPFRYQPPIDPTQSEAWTNAWLLCQLSAMNRSHAVIAVGGKPTGSASLLLLLAEGQSKSILPLTFLEGAAAQSFQRRQYALMDRLKDDVAALHDRARIGEAVKFPSETLASASNGSPRCCTGKNHLFFISYPRSRPQEADLVEMVLRRWGVEVLRDEQDFSPGNPLPGEISEFINKATHFIALWSAEYACSPWCFDEFVKALSRHAAGNLKLWILRVDKTEIVPPDARALLHYRLEGRGEIESQINKLLGQIL